MSDTILEVENLTVEFNGNKVLENINFNLKKGEVLAVVGPNGAGKTVMFKSLLGLLPYSGKIKWQPGIRIGYVPQKLAVERFFPLTVREFLALRLGNSGNGVHDEILSALHAVGIKTGESQEYHLEHHILNRPIGMLSGGELQRVLIAWSMIGNPNVLLFDEPTAGIDVGGEGTIYNLLHELQRSKELTILLISHDLNIVYKYADNVICLNKELICFGAPNEVLDPKSLSSLYGGEAKFYRHEH